MRETNVFYALFLKTRLVVITYFVHWYLKKFRFSSAEFVKGFKYRLGSRFISAGYGDKFETSLLLLVSGQIYRQWPHMKVNYSL